MNIGFMGMGKLGLPCALVINSRGHNVFGYDIDSNVKTILDKKELPYREELAPELLEKHSIVWSSVSELVSSSDIIFMPIQTPHDTKYEGVTRLPDERVDFDYSYLKAGIKTLADEIENQGSDKIVVIISTVLPGTIREQIIPLLNSHVKLCYNPFFIAMGTTIADFMNPEFVLFGVEDEGAFNEVQKLYATLHDKPVYKCTLEEAELIKVTYNTYITMKICLANTIMEISHKSKNINCDNVSRALGMATDRLVSPKYLYGGMGDGGGCHPRDNIALSWLAQKLDLSYDWYENLMLCREAQTDWLANLIFEQRDKTGMNNVVILGKSFKKETNLTVGSPAILLKNILTERRKPGRETMPSTLDVVMFDPWIDNGSLPLNKKSIFFIGTNHDVFVDYNFPKGSVVIDPWRIIPEQEGIEVIRVGASQ